jgi:hypothetical protein
MTAVAFLADLRARGVAVRAVGARLRVEAPRGVLTAGIVARLREEKPALLRFLAPPAPDDPEVARRLAAFTSQLEAWTTAGRLGAPLLVLPDAPVPRAGSCVSCGATIPEPGWRCEPCRHGVELALGLSGSGAG